MTFRYGHSASGRHRSMHGRAEECAGKCVAGLGPQFLAGVVPSILRRDKAIEPFPYPADGLRERHKSENNIPDTGVGMLRRCKSRNNIPVSGGMPSRCKSKSSVTAFESAGKGDANPKISFRALVPAYKGVTNPKTIFRAQEPVCRGGANRKTSFPHWSRQAKSRTRSESLFGAQTSINDLHAVSRRRCAPYSVRRNIH